MENKIVILGQLKYVVYENNNGFRICKFQLNKNKKKYITIKGILGNMINNVQYELIGNVTTDAKYGETFIVDNFNPVIGDDTEQLVHYFSSTIFPTIGKKTAQLIVDHYQSNVLEKIKQDYNSLFNITNLSSRHAQIIKNVLSNNEYDNDIQTIFYNNNLSQEILVKLKQRYNQEEIKAIFYNNPYQELLTLNFSFRQIDKLYLSFNQDKFLSTVRIAYLCWFQVIQLCQKSGSTYTDIEKLYIGVHKLVPEITKNQFLAGLNYIKEQKKLIFKDHKIFDEIIYFSEVNTAAFLTELHYNYHHPSKKIEKISEHNYYNPQQMQAINNALTYPVSMIVGNPGTGKTTVVKGVLKFFQTHFPNFEIALVAPTGKAAKRLRDYTCFPASTIHKLLRYDNENEEFFYNISNPLEYDVLIIDETSMVDIKLLGAIANAGGRIKKIVFIGDVNQLPSVACGNLMADIINSKMFPVTELTTIYRQTSGNDILSLCKAIVTKSDFPFNLNSNDVKFFNLQDPEEILKQTLLLYQGNLSSSKELTYQKLQVIAPMYNGPVGINMLNNYLQNALNYENANQNLRVGMTTFWCYDKVMQLKNRPEQNIYNGDVGIIVKINNFTDDIIMLIKFDDNLVEYNKEMILELTLAYACSVHKLQGSEYEKVIFVITNSSWPMLYQNLVYTAVSRAKQQLYLVGQEQAFIQASKKNISPRATMLTTFLLEKNDKIE